MKRYAPAIVLLVCAAAFVFGVAHLFVLRFEAGDVYPSYSSLRSDPLGTMALFESLDRLPGFMVKRDFSTNNRLPDGPETTYLHLAAPLAQWRELPEDTFKEIDRFVTSGGRLVITLFPASASPKPQEPEPGPPDAPEPEPQPGSRLASVTDRWGVDFEIVELKQSGRGVYEPLQVQRTGGFSLPEVLDWHSGIVLTNLDPAWNPVYMRETNPVVVERRFGRGAIVIATDSFFVSNEAMQLDRHSALLAWLVGPSRNVMFDEAHLGVTESPGVATLIRKYRLHWLAGALVLVGALFIWKNSVSLVPRRPLQGAEHHVIGKDAAAGFINLLRRSIPVRELLGVSFTEWRRSAAQSGAYSTARIQRAEAAFHAENSLGPRERDSVRAYQTISRILQTRIK